MKLKSGMRGKNNGLLNLIAELPWGMVMAEVGCYAGESTLMFLQSGKVYKLYAIDPWENITTDDDIFTETEKYVYNNIGWAEQSFDVRVKPYGDKVLKMKTDLKGAEADLPMLDFIYIDGDHRYKFVKEDIILAFGLVHKGGIIAGHDYNKDYPGVIKAVDEAFGKPLKVYKDSSWMIIV